MQFNNNNKSSKYIVEGANKYTFKTKEGEIISVDGKKEKISLKEEGHNSVVIKYKNKNYRAEIVEKKQNHYVVLINGNSYELHIETPRSYKRKQIISKQVEQGSQFEIKAPMPGKIIDIFIEKGDEVKVGDTLFTLEAMKMQNEIVADNAGIVADIAMNSGENVLKDQVLIVMDKS